jgi:tryptophan-rich sensory protein
MNVPLLYSLGICLRSAALEGLFAGVGVKARLAELRLPRFTPPLWTWIVIGLVYYAVCFFVLYRLFSLPGEDALRNACLALLGAVMFVNASWNYFFFRSLNLWHAFLVGLPYSGLAVTLFVLLLGLDCPAAWVLSPYLPYLVYANVWGYRVWRLSLSAETRDQGERGQETEASC